jgi:signal transduction histidine kinase
MDQQAVLAGHSIPTILHGIADGVTIQDAAGRLVYANDAAARICGYLDAAALVAAPADEVLGAVELLDGNGQPIVADDLPGRQALRGATPPEMLIRFRRRATGEECWSVVKARSVPDSEGRPLLVVNILRDVTDRMLYERELETKTMELQALNARLAGTNAELRQRTMELEATHRASDAARAAAEEARATAEAASQAKTQFLAVMSHELRTPLNGVLGYADLLSLGVGGKLNDAQLAHVERIRQSGRQLLELIDEVLSMARIEAGREVVQLTEEEGRAIARQAAAIVEGQAAMKKLTLVLEMPDVAVPLMTDSGRLRQVLLNLLSNAVKFTHEGSIVLKLSTDGSLARFEVIDTGIGIAADQVDRIFEPFTQVDQTNTRSSGGVGLGLTVSRRLAMLLGGTLECTSEPGRGTRFMLSLPLGTGPAA